MTRRTVHRTIEIPSEPCRLTEKLPFGQEVELAPIGVRGLLRNQATREYILAVRQQAPSCLRSPDQITDIFTSVARFYEELHEFAEVAGVTCDSPEAAAWVMECAYTLLGRATVTVGDRPVQLSHTPSDYNDYLSGGKEPAHSTGAHINLWSRRSLDRVELATLATIVAPLNAVFGPGGLTGFDERPRFTCDPRADHVKRLMAGRAHGGISKPFFLGREEPLASSGQRLQLVAIGGARSPVSCWLRFALCSWALLAVLEGKQPPSRVLHPIRALRANLNARVVQRRQGPGGGVWSEKTSLLTS